MEKWYLCTADLQGGDFAVGNVGTARHWKNIARSWCESDENEELSNELWHITKDEEIINFIQEIWTLEIIPINRHAGEMLSLLKKENRLHEEHNDNYVRGWNTAFEIMGDLVLKNQKLFKR